MIRMLTSIQIPLISYVLKKLIIEKEKNLYASRSSKYILAPGSKVTLPCVSAILPCSIESLFSRKESSWSISLPEQQLWKQKLFVEMFPVIFPCTITCCSTLSKMLTCSLYHQKTVSTFLECIHGILNILLSVAL